MSSEVRIKEEPVDSVYEPPSVNTGTAPENVGVKQGDNEDEADDDYAWVNDELDFLNEIDDLDAEDDEPQRSITPLFVKKEPESVTNVAVDSGGDNAAPSLDQPNVDDGIKVKVEKEDQGKSQEALSNGLDVGESCTSNRTHQVGISSEASESASKENGSTSGHEPASMSTSNSIELPVSVAKGAPSTNEQTNTLQGDCTGAYDSMFPIRIKQEKTSPSREIPASSFQLLLSSQNHAPPPPPPEEAQIPPPPPDDTYSPVSVKQERLTPPRGLQPTGNESSNDEINRSNSELSSRSKSPNKPSTISKRPPRLDEDAAFLQKQREKILKEIRKHDQPTASTSGEPPQKRRAIAKEIPQPIQIKMEPLDDTHAPNAQPNCAPVDMELESDQEPSPMKKATVKNPMALKLMPQPLRVKQEPVDTYEMEVPKSMPYIKAEKLDEKPLSHRQRVLKFAKQTIKNFDLFESVPKLKRRFLYTPTILLRENADKLNENRSPLNSSIGLQYEFSCQKAGFSTEQWGICKLGEPTAKIVRLLGFNAYEFSQRSKGKMLEKLDNDDTETTQANNSAAYFVNSSTQTEELKCNKCIVRKLRMFTDRSTQASMAPVVTSSSAPNELYENIPQHLLHTLSQLAPAQHTALEEFTELILGPSPTSTNDVQKMRERLMDIFTLAQSQGGNKAKSKPFSSSSNTPVSVLFNQPDHSRHKPMQQMSFHRTPSAHGQPIPTLSRQQAPMQTNYHSVSQMQPPQGNFHSDFSAPQPVPPPYSHSAPLFPAAGPPQPVPDPYIGQLYDPGNPTGYQYQQQAGPVPGMMAMPQHNPFPPPPRQAAVRDPRSNNIHLPVVNRRW